MDFKLLKTFLAVAQHLHYGQAAAELRIAQPHVSRRIKQLEEELGVVLFLRDRRNVRLTQAGEVLRAEARTLLADADLIRTRTRESADGRRGHLTVSTIGVAMLGALPAILSDFREHYPQVQLTFREDGSVVQEEALAQGASDVAFLHPVPRTDRLFSHLIIEQAELIAAVPAGHRLAGAERIELRELSGDPWVMNPRAESAPIYDRVISACQRAGFSPAVVQEAGPVQVRLGLVAAGFGVHLLPSVWGSLRYPGVAFVPTAPSITFPIACYWRADDPNPLLKNFVGVVRRHI